MKVILREYDGKDYVVKNISLNETGKYVYDNNIIDECNILTVLDTGKQEFVKCSACGEMVRNTKKAIEEHLAKGQSYQACAACPFARISSSVNKKIKLTKNDDNTLRRVINDNVKITCNYNTYFDVTSEERLTRCLYAKCSKDTIMTDGSFFGKYPNAFDDMITVDAVKFKEIYESGSKTNLRLKCRGIIEAIANSKGIIDSFRVYARYENRQVYYSKKYNELFCVNKGKYVKFVPTWTFTQDKIDYIKKTIANMYN